MMKTITLILGCLFSVFLQSAFAGLSYWRGAPPAISFLEAAEIAKTALTQELGVTNAATYQWCSAVIQGGGYWSIKFVRSGVKNTSFRDVHVIIRDGKASVQQPYGQEYAIRPQHPCTNALGKARARLGPDQSNYYCVVAAYWPGCTNWYFAFQKDIPQFCWTRVEPNGNVGGFMEATPADSTNDVAELLEGLNITSVSGLPYGSEEVDRKALSLSSNADNQVVTLSVVCLPIGFNSLQSASVLEANRCVLVYRVINDYWPTGIGTPKKVSWQIPRNIDPSRIRVIHRPDRVQRY